MNSWTLFRHTPHLWDTQIVQHPIVEREIARPPFWHQRGFSVERTMSMLAMLLLISFVVLIFGAPVSAAPVVMTSALCFLAPALVFAPSLPLWPLVMGLTLGPTIVRERAAHTWDILRMIPAGTDAILLYKLHGALWWLRGSIRTVQIIWLMGMTGMLLISADSPGRSVSLLPLGVALVFWADRMQQLILMALAALAGGVIADGPRSGVALAVTGAFAVWIVDLLAAAIMLMLHSAQDVNNSVSVGLLILLGPVGAYRLEFSMGATMLLGLATLTVREGAVRLLWAGMQRAVAR